MKSPEQKYQEATDRALRKLSAQLEADGFLKGHEAGLNSETLAASNGVRPTDTNSMAKLDELVGAHNRHFRSKKPPHLEMGEGAYQIPHGPEVMRCFYLNPSARKARRASPK